LQGIVLIRLWFIHSNSITKSLLASPPESSSPKGALEKAFNILFGKEERYLREVSPLYGSPLL
jgi:hypothetical protein